MNTSHEVFDYAIVGAGAAGLQLALAMLEDDFFKDKKVLLLEKDSKTQNDRTWCYWEKGKGKYDKILHKSWSDGSFFSSAGKIDLDLGSYTYKMIRSAAFYTYAKERINKSTSFKWVNQEVLNLMENNKEVMLISPDNTWYAKHVFDSRIDQAYYSDKKSTKILQHFKGWIIESEASVFDPETFVMMDYRYRLKNNTSFIYVLPFTSSSALIEFTLFTPELLEDEEYDVPLKRYIDAIPGIKNYSVFETEKGIIPMSDYDFHKHHSKRITKIGTAGGWVKSSSGYSFHNGTVISERIVEAIKNNREPSSIRSKSRFRFYDRLFLDVLFQENKRGPEIFSAMYAKNQASQIFRFLDEETTLLEEIKIIGSFPSPPFLKALFRRGYKGW